MSLTKNEQVNTINELHQSFDNSGLTLEDVADSLNTDPQYIADLLNLKAHRIEDPWILKNFLEQYNQAHQLGKVEFTALKGDYHDYWFLNAQTIDMAVLN